MAPEFNLLDEPWIRVLKKDCSEQEVSITEALIHAHEYLDLSGDMQEQDMEVLRLLLAVLHTVFSRMTFVIKKLRRSVTPVRAFDY